MKKPRGSLAVVGSGIESMGQMTPAARREIERAQELFYLVSDPLTPARLKELNPRAQSLHHLYAVGKHRLRTYAAIVERVLAEVRRGKRVCLVLYGHPGVFALPGHAAVRRAQDEGYRASMLPGVSADACMIADLNVDPSNGWQAYEATDFLLRNRRADPGVSLVLWQVGAIGTFDYPAPHADPAKVKVLSDRLAKTYSPKHVGLLYEASILPGFDPIIEEVALGKLHRAKVSVVTTLYVPPERRAVIDPKMLRKLGIKPEDRIGCLR
jgi:uncharacterized protein YabN with tetrapyrrole methylase and pyrophosphatase domain